ncbi:MAG TPA: N-acetyl-gamma-glutamyl-phosphate reductase, partial [Candidatus Avacidaminococcus intestinavium]|nr:N-acetyl-gamma-glutamyl-phosphate reductase [Candidatus Avacidaminococcus intestinavium]
AEIIHITSESSTGEAIASMYPHLKKRINLNLTTMNDLNKIASDSDVIFIALPHGHAMKIGKILKNTGVRLIDLGGDYRFKDIETFEHWYQVKHEDPETRAVYGLTELYRKEVAQANIVANPGCYTTCSILALAPLLKNKLIDINSIIIDAKSGTTGAGRSLKQGSLYCAVNENFKAYGVAKHRHTPEIEQAYSALAGERVCVQFTPHLLPLDRGIFATLYASLHDGVNAKQIAKAYEQMYSDEFFIRLLGKGGYPELKYVRASNYVDIGWEIDERTGKIVVMSVLDNLVKGAAGQAVQNMNVMFGLKETMGLRQLPIYP